MDKIYKCSVLFLTYEQVKYRALWNVLFNLIKNNIIQIYQKWWKAKNINRLISLLKKKN